MLDICLEYPSAWTEFSISPIVYDLHEQLLFRNPNPAIRITASHMVKRKLESYPTTSHLERSEFTSFLWSIISKVIPRIEEQPSSSAELFDVARYLFHALTENRMQCFLVWSEMVVNNYHRERVGRNEVDLVLRGLASLLQQCTSASSLSGLTSAKASLKDAIWWKFLFQEWPRTSEQSLLLSRNLPVLETTTCVELVNLLVALTTDMESLVELVGIAARVPIENKFVVTIDKSTLLRSPAGFVGLKNLGNTCYMNALVTQLFMNPVFRSFILDCRAYTNPSNSPLLFETQRLFAQMQNSYAKAASAHEFTEKIETLTEESIDVREQMDVDEFMNTLFMRWEEQMPTKESKERFRSVYTGKTIQQIKSKECEHVSERDDTCLAIQCDVQGKVSLQESLKAFTEGDVMEGGTY